MVSLWPKSVHLQIFLPTIFDPAIPNIDPSCYTVAYQCDSTQSINVISRYREGWVRVLYMYIVGENDRYTAQ